MEIAGPPLAGGSWDGESKMPSFLSLVPSCTFSFLEEEETSFNKRPKEEETSFNKRPCGDSEFFAQQDQKRTRHP
jgi:hypothetical protein